MRDFETDPIKLYLKPYAKPFHGRPYPIPQKQIEVFKKEVEILILLGVLRAKLKSELGSSAFIIPKADKTVRFMGNFREVNKRLVPTPFSIPKINTVL